MSGIHSNEGRSSKENVNANSHSSLWAVVVIVGLTLVLIASYKLKMQLISPIITTLTVKESCTLENGSCMAILSNGAKVRLAITPKDIPLLKPLTLKVTLDGAEESDGRVKI